MNSIQPPFLKVCFGKIMSLMTILLISQISFANDLTKEVIRLQEKLLSGIAHESYDGVYNEANALLETATGKKDYDNLVRINVLLADLYLSKLGQLSSAEKYLFEASKYVSKVKNYGIVMKFKYIFSKQNYLTGNYSGAKKHLYELIETTINRGGNELKLGAYYHAIGTIWERELRLDSARYYYNKSIEKYESVTEDPLSFFNPIHDIIKLDILEKKFDSNIIERIDHQIELSAENNRSSYIIGFLLLASEFYYETDQLIEALIPLDRAMKIADSVSVNDNKRDLFEAYSKVYKKLKNHELALEYYEKYATLKDSMETAGSEFRFSTAELLLHSAEVEREMYKVKVNNQQNESERKTLIFFLSIAILFVVLIIIILVLVRSKNKKYRQLSEENIALKNKELKFKEEELGTFATDIIRRSSLMKEIQSELKKIKNQPNDDKLKEELNALLINVNNQSYVNNQLVDIQNKVEDINNNYYLKLGELCPSLTNADKQLCSMIKLDLSQSELAIVFGIETLSLKTKKYRLKKKLGLTQEQDLAEYLKAI